MDVKNEKNLYVCLLSNNSMDCFPNNTLAAFTNLLKKHLKLNQEWYVGLTEIGYGSFSGDHAKLVQHINILRESSGDELDEVKIIPMKRSRRTKKQHVNRKIQRNASLSKDNNISILLNGNLYSIWLSELQKLQKITYDKKQKNINFNRFLSFLNKLITNEEDKKSAKQQILEFINSETFKNNVNKIESSKNNFTLHVYQGSNVSNNVVINLDNIAHTVKSLINELLLQIPKNKRKPGSLRYSVNTFFVVEKKKSAPQPKKKKIADTKINIPFEEFGVSLTANTKELAKQPDGSVDLNDIIDNFDVTSTTKIDDRNVIKENIKNVMLDYLSDNEHNREQIVKTLSDGDLKINVPIANGKSYQMVLEVKDYNRVEKFLDEILDQLPKDQRNKRLLAESISRISKANEDDVNVEAKIIIPKELASLAPTQAKDVIIVENSNVPSNLLTTTTEVANNKIINLATSSNTTTGLMLVYTDIIYPRSIGNTESRYLRIIPCADSKGGCIEFKNIEYVPLEKTYMESISVIIADGKGEKIKFNASTKPTYIMLHFKSK